MRRHRLLPTRRARTDERRLSAACGVTRLTDCASLLFPLHVSHPRHTSVQLLGCPVRTAPPNPQFPPPRALPANHLQQVSEMPNFEEKHLSNQSELAHAVLGA
jgi:hypothetical protein